MSHCMGEGCPHLDHKSVTDVSKLNSIIAFDEARMIAEATQQNVVRDLNADAMRKFTDRKCKGSRRK